MPSHPVLPPEPPEPPPEDPSRRVRVIHRFNKKEARYLENYRTFFNRTRGKNYQDVDELISGLTEKYLDSLVRQMECKKREKVLMAYRVANKGQQEKVDALLGVTDEE